MDQQFWVDILISENSNTDYGLVIELSTQVSMLNAEIESLHEELAKHGKKSK